MRWRLGLRPRPRWGAYDAPSDPLVGRGFAPLALATRYFLAPYILLTQIYPPPSNSTFLESPLVLSNPRPHPLGTLSLVSRPSGPQLYGPLTYFPVIRPLVDMVALLSSPIKEALYKFLQRMNE